MREVIRGRVWKFGDDINTDVIISGKYKFKTLDMGDLAKHAMEGVDPNFSRKVVRGDVMVAGWNFGCGSSREQAPRVLKCLGVGAVVAKSFARIFYRNAINVGLPVVECVEVCEGVAPGEILEINLEEGLMVNASTGIVYRFKPLPPFLLEILSDGGLIEHFKRWGGFRWLSTG